MMESPQRVRKRDRISALFRRKDQTPPTSEAPQTSQTASGVTESADRQRTKARYREAAKLLEEAVKGRESQWGKFEFPELVGELENFDVSEFKDNINSILEKRKGAVQDDGAWGKCEHAINCFFTAFSPFAKNFLIIAKQAQEIPVLNPYGLICGGLLLLITIAEKEIGRRAELDRNLDYMCQQLEQLAILDVLPDDLEQREFVINRALDVRSASMLYLAINIRHDSTSLGIPGKVIKVFFTGDEKITDSKVYLEKCVDGYSRALSNIVGVRMAALNVDHRTGNQGPIENKFLVPYQENPRFIGRTNLLNTLKDSLYAEVPRQFNHRVALYGMGGIGKTQCVLAYVYANRNNYERIYWITAVDQAALLSGYQRIANEAQLPGLQGANPVVVANAVLCWLKQKPSLLLVIDNLDDIKVADGFLPENGPHQHTLITTRNPNTKGIPAEPLEVPLLDREGSIDLLSTLSEVDVQPGSIEYESASKIVDELRYLPLAIEQAAAYVREVTGKFSAYYDAYLKNHKELIQWLPTGNRQYPYSVATTWSMSFDVVGQAYPPVTRLLQLFSLMNPDGILIDFLVAGAKGLIASEVKSKFRLRFKSRSKPQADSKLKFELQHILSSQSELAKALLELEKFSLIKWDRQHQSISIHRLVQTVVRDDMPREELTAAIDTLMDLFIAVFPEHITNETRPICRRYQAQVVEPLLRLEENPRKVLHVKIRVGRFLSNDGKYEDAEKLLESTFQIYKEVLGPDDVDTLGAMHSLCFLWNLNGGRADAIKLNEDLVQRCKTKWGHDNWNTFVSISSLAQMYQDNGRVKEAVKMGEEVLKKARTVLGEEDSLTLCLMHELALSYSKLGYSQNSADLELVLKTQRRLHGDEHFNTLVTLHNLASSYYHLRRFEEATKLQEEVLEKMSRLLGTEHPHTLEAMNNLSRTYNQLGRKREALKMGKEVLEKRSRLLGTEHPHTLGAMQNLSKTYDQLGRKREALKMGKEVLAKRRVVWGQDHRSTVRSMKWVAYLYRKEGEDEEAAALEKEAQEVRQRISAREGVVKL